MTRPRAPPRPPAGPLGRGPPGGPPEGQLAGAQRSPVQLGAGLVERGGHRRVTGRPVLGRAWPATELASTSVAAPRRRASARPGAARRRGFHDPLTGRPHVLGPRLGLQLLVPSSCWRPQPRRHGSASGRAPGRGSAARAAAPLAGPPRPSSPGGRGGLSTALLGGEPGLRAGAAAQMTA